MRSQESSPYASEALQLLCSGVAGGLSVALLTFAASARGQTHHQAAPEPRSVLRMS
jgi:hypothetical protein